MRKVLYVVTSDSFMRAFNLPYLKWFKEHGYEVHVAFENRFNYPIPHCDKVIDLPFKRNPFHPENYKAYKQMKALIEEHQYELIHCHTPVPAAITRLAAAKARKKGTKVLYTAHGFHFYKGASRKNWMIYYTAEKALAHITDGIITINKEDFSTAQKSFKTDKVFYISGVGIDVNRFKPTTTEEVQQYRAALALTRQQFVMLYVAEFIPRKNHQFIFECLPALVAAIPDLKLVLAGRGILMEQMKKQIAENGLEKHVDFLGFRTDMENIVPVADVCISASRQEGLPFGVAEGMMCSKPVVASHIRGHEDLIDNEVNGFLFSPGNKAQFINAVIKLYEDPSLKDRMGRMGSEKIQQFSIDRSLESMERIYSSFLAG